MKVRAPWRWIDITMDVDKKDLDDARNAAAASNPGKLRALPFSEGNAAWVLLYNHVRVGQIDPSVMKRMRRSDLEYLAGMAFPHPDLVEPKRVGESDQAVQARHEQATKLLGNVARAKSDLSRRNLRWATLLTACAALVGAVIGAVLTKI